MSHATSRARVGPSALAASLVLLIVGSTTPVGVTVADVFTGVSTRPAGLGHEAGTPGQELLRRLPTIDPSEISLSAMPATPGEFHRAETLAIRRAERAVE